MKTPIGYSILILLFSCDGPATVVDPTILSQKITLDKNEITLNAEIRESTVVNLTFFPKNTTDKVVAWKSSNPTVAEVNASGEIVAAGEGTTTIKAIAIDSGLTVTLKVMVSGKPIPKSCAILGENGGEQYITALSTSGGQNNIQYKAMTYPEKGYELYNKERVTISKGGEFSISYTNATTWSLSRVWIDWNRDGTFLGDEIVSNFGTPGKDLTNGLTHTEKISVPTNIVSGLRLMRILNIDSYKTSVNPKLDPCGDKGKVYDLSSVKDFLVEVK